MLPKKKVEDSKSIELIDEIVEMKHLVTDQNTYPQLIKLNVVEKLRCRQVEYVLRYHVSNKHKNPEAYIHHLHFIFNSFRNEQES